MTSTQATNGPTGTTSELVKTVSIPALVMKRDRIIARIREAHRLLNIVDEEAHATKAEHELGRGTVWCLGLSFSAGGRTFTDERGVELAAKKIDAWFWSYLLAESGMQSFLDATTREEWRKSIDREDVPELTVANIEATFSALYKQRGEMFERGVIEMFRKLSHDYKTNTPVKLGKRLILEYAVERYHGKDKSVHGVAHNASDKLDDLLRVMFMLDGKPELDHRRGAWHTLRQYGSTTRTETVYARGNVHASGTREVDVPGPGWMTNNPNHYRDATLHGMFSIRGFKNGNGHITFLRPDLVDKMNAIIAKHYPNALPPADERSNEEDT